ncbi:MAG: histidine phosphatase family protein [Saprospiraceae bacterium]|nr:histidine phosphatase family protein [Saprospiraceae bacterium]
MLSSTAVRAYSTARFIAEALDYKIELIQQEKAIYEASVNTVLEVLRGLSDDKNVVFIFGHNPTFTMIANDFSDDYIENVPTCGIVAVEFDVDNWENLHQNNSRFLSFDFPKNYL